MKKKIYFVAIILFIVFGFDIMIGAVSKQAIKSVNDVGLNKTNTAQALFKRKADVLILGSSRANHSFDCKIMHNELGLSCYNAGRDGMNIMYDGIVLFSYLERYLPKLVVLDLNSAMLDDSWNDTWKEMLCFYGMTEAIDEVINNLANPIEKFKLQSNIYRYNKTWEWLLKAKYSQDQSFLDGYRPMPVQHDSPGTVDSVNQTFKADKNNLEMLDKIVKRCKDRGIQLIITYSPSLIVDKGGFARFLSDYGRKNHLVVFNWNGDVNYSSKPRWFYDKTHLNEDGAKYFTKDFLAKLKSLDK